VCTIATGNTTFRPSVFDRSSGTVSVPHWIRALFGTSLLHRPSANTGVYRGLVVVVAALALDGGLALLPDVQAASTTNTRPSARRLNARRFLSRSETLALVRLWGND
jgi:hypothetical protein